MKIKVLGAFMVLACLAAGCSKNKNGSDNEFPEGFSRMGDTAQVAWMMKHATPDSVARFICNASLGKVPGAQIDTLAVASLYAFENYKGEQLNAFSDEYESYTSSLPLPLKMQILAKAGQNDPQNLGYQMGLEYVQQIRDNHMNAAQVQEELDEFKKACAQDTDTYRRFRIGLKTAIIADSGTGIPADVQQKFSHFE